MVDDLCLGLQVVGAETQREPDGLAMSSRNRYLDADQRRDAVVLSRALRRAQAEAAYGVESALAAARAPRWWLWIASESTPMTWLQSVVLLGCAASALLHAALIDLRGPLPTVPSSPGRQRAVWFLVSAGFGALALDERFALHERLRDRVLAPHDVRLPFADWMAPGDFVLLAVLLVGLLTLPGLYRQLRSDRPALVLFALGLALTVTALLADSYDPNRMPQAAERLEQTLEECVELAAALSFLTGLFLPLLTRLASAVEPQGGEVLGVRTVGQLGQSDPEGPAELR
jgi:hypothetical protein